MSLAKEIEKLKFDKRLTDWHIRTGKMSRQEHEQLLKSLPDSADNVDSLKLQEDDSDLNGSGDHQ